MFLLNKLTSRSGHADPHHFDADPEWERRIGYERLVGDEGPVMKAEWEMKA